MHSSVLIDAIVFLLVAVVATPLCQRLRVSPIVGYLVAGSLVGPAGLGLVEDGEGTRGLAELGVVFLLFMIGLELSLDRLRVIRRFIFGLGSAQVIVTGLVLGGAAWGLGWLPGPAAAVIGLALAFSSTAFVLQILVDRGELTTQHGRMAVAVLILQDLAVVPLLVTIPHLAGEGGAMVSGIATAMGKAFAALAVIFLTARLAMRPLFHAVAATRSPEVFVAAALLAVIGTSFATSAIGLSHSLGAFLAGVLLAGTEYRHQVEADLQPVRGLLMGLFFMTVGMTIDVQSAIANLPVVAAGAAGLLAAKALVITLVAMAFRFPMVLALALGLLLAQGGEFAFVVLAHTADAGLANPATVSLLTTIVALSMAATPLLAQAGDWMLRRRAAALGEAVKPKGETDDLTDHVILVGFGRVGRTIGQILTEQAIPYVAVDRDPRMVAVQRQRGLPAFYGDARKPEVLRQLGAERARAVVMTIDSGSGRERIVPRLKVLFPNLRILVRARDRKQARGLEALGATAVVPETLEGSLQLAGVVLRSLGQPAEEVQDVLDGYRRNDYGRLSEE